MHQVAHVLDVEHRRLGPGDADVRVRAGERRAAGVALPAAGAPLALQGRGERDRGVGATGAGRAGEQPRVRHAVAGDGPLQGLDGVLLADERWTTRRRAAVDVGGSRSLSWSRARPRPRRLSQQRPQPGLDLARRSPRPGGGRRRRGSAPAMPLASCEEHLAHPLVELDGLRLDAVPLVEAGQPLLRRQVEQRRSGAAAGRRSPSAPPAPPRGPPGHGRPPGRPASSRRSGR